MISLHTFSTVACSSYLNTLLPSKQRSTCCLAALTAAVSRPLPPDLALPLAWSTPGDLWQMTAELHCCQASPASKATQPCSEACWLIIIGSHNFACGLESRSCSRCGDSTYQSSGVSLSHSASHPRHSTSATSSLSKPVYAGISPLQVTAAAGACP